MTAIKTTIVTTNAANKLHWLYPASVGCLPGLLQTGLFFQLNFSLSSSFGTYLLITLCWIIGSAAGVYGIARLPLPVFTLSILSLLAYGACSLLVLTQPFNTDLWWIYGLLIVAAGVYPGVFFARMSRHTPARTLFLWENNGFLAGIIMATFAFMLWGRVMLWTLPLIAAGVAGILQTQIREQHDTATP